MSAIQRKQPPFLGIQSAPKDELKEFFQSYFGDNWRKYWQEFKDRYGGTEIRTQVRQIGTQAAQQERQAANAAQQTAQLTQMQTQPSKAGLLSGKNTLIAIAALSAIALIVYTLKLKTR